MRHSIVIAAAALLLATPAIAHDRDYGQGGATYNFYGPSTNYFGPMPAYGQPAAPYPSAYDSGYMEDGPDAYPGYGYPPGYPAYDRYGEYDNSYDGARLDPWHGYSPAY